MALGTAIGAGIQGAIGLGKIITGGIQTKRGKKDLAELEANRPEYTRPEEVKQAGRISRLRYLNPYLPGQNLMEQKIGQQQANTIQNIKDMGGVSDIYQTQIASNNAMNEIGISAAQQKLQNEMNLLNQLQAEADYADKEFDVNTYIPWQEKRQSALDRIGAGTKNIFGGLDSFGTLGAGLMGLPKSSNTTSAVSTTPTSATSTTPTSAASKVLNLDKDATMSAIKAAAPSIIRQKIGNPMLNPINPIPEISPDMKLALSIMRQKIGNPTLNPINPIPEISFDMKRTQNPSFPIVL